MDQTKRCGYCGVKGCNWCVPYSADRNEYLCIKDCFSEAEPEIEEPPPSAQILPPPLMRPVPTKAPLTKTMMCLPPPNLQHIHQPVPAGLTSRLETCYSCGNTFEMKAGE